MGYFHKSHSAREPIGGSDAGRLKRQHQCCSGLIAPVFVKNGAIYLFFIIYIKIYICSKNTDRENYLKLLLHNGWPLTT